MGTPALEIEDLAVRARRISISPRKLHHERLRAKLERYRELGYACYGVHISWDAAKQRKKLTMPKEWQKFTPETPIEQVS